MATAGAQPDDVLPVALLVTWSSVLALVLLASAYISFGPEPPQKRVEPLVLALPPFEEATWMAQPQSPAAAQTTAESAESGNANSASANASGAEPESPDLESATGAATAAAAEEASETEVGADESAGVEAADSETTEQTADTSETPDETVDAMPDTNAKAGDPETGDATQLAALRLPEPTQPTEPAWQVHRRPFDETDTRPRIAVVVTGLGLSENATMAAIKTLPPEVTLSFTPYSRNLNQIIALARANGHEVMLDLPMEPMAFPDNDPGPRALLTGLAEEEILSRLEWVMGRGSAYVGLAGVMGSRFTGSLRHMTPVLQTLRDKGLLFLDNRSTETSVSAMLASQMGMPFAINNRLVDERQASRVAIDSRLAQVERIALAEGAAVAMARPFPVTFERLLAWLEDFEKRGLVLAPITALANRQPLR